MRKEYLYLLIGGLVGAVVVLMFQQKQTPIQPVPVNVRPAVASRNNTGLVGYQPPDQLTFASERVPLEREHVYERLEREILVNAFWHSNSIILLKRANRWLPTIDSILRAHGIPEDFKYMAVAESGLSNVVSPSKAVGFWQFLEGTAKDFGLTVTDEVDQRYDPVASTVAATKYLKKAYDRFGSWTMVCASYNMGMNATARAIAKQQPGSYYELFLSEEPSRYVFRIIALKCLLEKPDSYGFVVDEIKMYHKNATIQRTVDQSISDMHSFASEYGVSYFELRQLNPWIRDTQLTIRHGQHYIFNFPVE